MTKASDGKVYLYPPQRARERHTGADEAAVQQRVLEGL